MNARILGAVALAVLLPVLAHAQDLTYVASFGTSAPASLQFPAGVAVSPVSGEVSVTNRLASRVVVFDRAGNYLRSWGSPGTGPGQFYSPAGIAVGPDGSVYVGDGDNDSPSLAFLPRIQVFTPAGTFVRQWDSYGSGDGQFGVPIHVAVDASGPVYPPDGGHRVQSFLSVGTWL